LNLTEYTQPALLVSSIAALHVFKPLGITPVAVAGHSLGEYSALVAAGEWLIVRRCRSCRSEVAIWPKRFRRDGARRRASWLKADMVKEVCRDASSVGVVAAANFNSPGQVVIAGEKAAVERAIELAKAKGM